MRSIKENIENSSVATVALHRNSPIQRDPVSIDTTRRIFKTSLEAALENWFLDVFSGLSQKTGSLRKLVQQSTLIGCPPHF